MTVKEEEKGPGAEGSEPENTEQSESLENLPPEEKKIVETSMLAMRHFGPVPHPLADKINAEHIDKILEMTDKKSDLAHKDKSESRRYFFTSAAVVVAVFVFLTIYLAGPHTDIYMKLIETILAFLGGLGSGVWIKTRMDRK
ncbi:MAG: hypothetical protein OXF42_01685 [Candidatus Dadabacteria bacterium]|nr:hypothetical protein [Candidatus Dadabacteria bacterium]